MYGPLNKISSIRLEAKHKPHKEYAKIIFCRKNLPWSLAVKEQLNLSQRFFSENSINWNLPEFGPVLNSELVREELPSALMVPKDPTFYKWITVNGIKYEAVFLLQTGITDTLPQMSSATHFFTSDNTVFAIVRDEWVTSCFSQHFHCFLAEKISEVTINIINIESVLSFPTTITNLSGSTNKGFLIKRQLSH
jgi:hypothetical protein